MKETNRRYESVQASPLMCAFMERHGIKAASYLTIADDKLAELVMNFLRDRIEGKTVIEIGGGIGLLALHMGAVAKRVYCIEANPVWASFFSTALMEKKTRNVSYVFGAADEFVGVLKGDVAIYCTHSDVKGMGLVAAQFAPTVIDVWGELIDSNPDAFDPLARVLRGVA